ncbi:hypothetical protein [Prauserella endophytica]|uniref:Preprotein translocase subunit SecE n=1 Tax=Prauserella endophytica TaxID=1592324 RepID=A0ABY2S3R0_9PSEU|nr:hypothetical protein [Prauserella endophytica]PXY34282.1 hypothetical protein BAY59_01670 [Prauserella coralliicola]TKG70028.1 hypothetical protein FCN18_18165 [Prauserella endophytica]
MANGDGTQAPEPPQSFSDPLSGLVTSGKPDFTATTQRDQPTAMPLAMPVEPDPDMVKGMVDAALGDETPKPEGAEATEATVEGGESPPPGAPAGAALSGEGGPPGVYSGPDRSRWPARTQLLPEILRRRQRNRVRESRPWSERQLIRRPSSGSAGLAVALVLLTVFGIVAIQFISSLVESITGLFN